MSKSNMFYVAEIDDYGRENGSSWYTTCKSEKSIRKRTGLCGYYRITKLPKAEAKMILSNQKEIVDNLKRKLKAIKFFETEKGQQTLNALKKSGIGKNHTFNDLNVKLLKKSNKHKLKREIKKIKAKLKKESLYFEKLKA